MKLQQAKRRINWPAHGEGQPRRPPGVFFYFMRTLPREKGVARTVHLRNAGQKWREMPEAEKDRFYRIWHREMIEYQRKYDDWVAEEKVRNPQAADRPWRHKLNVDVEVYMYNCVVMYTAYTWCILRYTQYI